MKKFIILLLIIATLVGCSGQDVTEASNENVRFAGIKGNVTIVIDNETGCKYIREQVHKSFSNAHSIALTTLLKSDGTPDCN